MTVIQLAAPAVAVAMAAAATGAVAQAVTGFGFSLVTAPFLVLLVGPQHAVRLVNLLALTFNVIMLAREHNGVDLGNAARLLAPALAVAPSTHRCRHPRRLRSRRHALSHLNTVTVGRAVIGLAIAGGIAAVIRGVADL